MHNSVVVIHPSEIVLQGFYSMIKGLFDIEPVLLTSLDSLTNHVDANKSQLLILADESLDKIELTNITLAFPKTLHPRIIHIRQSDDLSCDKGCKCCLPLNASKSRISELIRPILAEGSHPIEKRKSSGLTERETDVVKLVALGKTNKEIARELYISIHTVISHRKNITEKLGIKSISGLTVYAILNNLIDTHSIDPESLI